MLDSLLFKISPDKDTAVLAVPEMCMDRIIVYLQDISDKFFTPNLIHYLRLYIKGYIYGYFLMVDPPFKCTSIPYFLQVITSAKQHPPLVVIPSATMAIPSANNTNK